LLIILRAVCITARSTPIGYIYYHCKINTYWLHLLSL